MHTLRFVWFDAFFVRPLVQILFVYIFFSNFFPTGVVSGQDLVYQNFTVKDGLPSNTIYSIKQDRKGYIWITTDQGVSRYDGYGFTNFNVADGLTDTDIFDSFEDSSGRIWFSTFNGKICYYFDGVFYNSKSDTTLKNLDSNSMITRIKEDVEGYIWISTLNSGLFKYKNEVISELFRDESETIHDFEFFDDQSIVVIGVKAVYRLIETNRIPLLESTIEYKSCPEARAYRSKSLKLNDNELLFFSKGKIFKLEYSKLEITELVTNPSNNFISNLCSQRKNTWICKHSGAYPLSNLQKGELINYAVTTVFEDLEGNTWFGTNENGIFIKSQNKIYKYSKSQGLLENTVNSLTTGEEGKLWFSYRTSYVGKLEINKVVNIKLDSVLNGIKQGRNNRIIVREKSCWLATDNGLRRIYQNEELNISVIAKDLQLDEDGFIWMTSRYGLFHFTESDFESFSKISRGILEISFKHRIFNERTEKLLIDLWGNIWFSTKNDVLVRRRHTGEVIKQKWASGYRLNKFVNGLDSSIFLLTKSEGLINYDPNEEKIIRFKDELESNNITGLTFENDSTFWVTTGNGLKKIVGYPHDIRVESYWNNPELDFGTLNDILYKNDTLYIAKDDGILLFKVDSLGFQSLAPFVNIENVEVNGKRLANSNNELNYNENNLKIDFVGISSLNGPGVSYRYRLKSETEWQYTSNRSIDLVLPPDDYHFEVCAKANNSEWSRPASFNFTISKPPWKTIPFLVLVGLSLTVVMTFAIYRINRTRALKMVQEQKLIASELRSLKAQMNPHFMFNALNTIQGELLGKSPELAGNYLVKLSRLMRQILDYSDRSYVEISDELDMLINYLELERYKTSGKFQYDIQVSSKIDVYAEEIPSMLIQPFIENSIWHGFKDKNPNYKIEIKLDKPNENELTIKIIDNGIGRQNAAQQNDRMYKSKSMEIIRDRIDALNFGRKKKIFLSISDVTNNGTGTKVTITIPSINDSNT